MVKLHDLMHLLLRLCYYMQLHLIVLFSVQDLCVVYCVGFISLAVAHGVSDLAIHILPMSSLYG